MSSIIYENSNYPPEKSDIPLALRTEKCNNILALLLLVRDASVMGFMSGGMVADTASEGFCNYLYYIRSGTKKEKKHDDIKRS